MKLLDANLLLYAYDANSSRHSEARRWLESAFDGPDPVCFSWATLLAFVRISTNSRAVAHPLTIEQSCAIVSSWLAQPLAVLLSPGERHWEILNGLLVTAQARGPLAMDAHLAALAIEHGATLYTDDRDFTRFESLKWVNPLGPEKSP